MKTQTGYTNATIQDIASMTDTELIQHSRQSLYWMDHKAYEAHLVRMNKLQSRPKKRKQTKPKPQKKSALFHGFKEWLNGDPPPRTKR